MMKTYFKLLIFFSIIALFGSCSDPIFHTVFQETPKLKPLIGGSPTNFVTFNSKLYVASGKKIWEYNGTSWKEYIKLSGFVGNLAATNSSLYVTYIKGNGNDGRIKIFTSTPDYYDLPISNVQSIHAVDNVLFACNSSGTISYTTDNATFTQISTATGILNGVASDSTHYYLCTDKGIFCASKSSPSTATSISDKNFVGIINTSTNIIAAISNDGKLYQVTNTGITEKASFPDDKRNPTGMLAVWSDGTDSLLLAGRREYYYSTSTGYTNGYLEIALDASGNITGSFGNPGKSCNYDSYVSSLGKEPVNHFIQTPSSIDTNKTLFASTQKNGVWSYRDRNDGNGITWNAEQ